MVKFNPDRYGPGVDPSVAYGLESRRVGAYAGMEEDVSSLRSQATQKQAQGIASQRASAEAAQAEKEAWYKDQGWRREMSKDGGFNFYDPDGNPITVWEYAQNRQVGLSDALQGSQNPDDMAMVDKYQTRLQEAAVYGGSLKDVVGSLKKEYPHAFGETVIAKDIPWVEQATTLNEATARVEIILQQSNDSDLAKKFIDSEYVNQGKLTMEVADRLKVQIDEQASQSGSQDVYIQQWMSGYQQFVDPNLGQQPEGIEAPGLWEKVYSALRPNWVHPKYREWEDYKSQYDYYNNE